MIDAASLAGGLAALGVELDVVARERLLAYAALLEKWNRTYNLTAVRQADAVLGLHFLDSLALLPYVGDMALVDVGSGGGLPGIPLAVARPQLAVTLLDKSAKKAAFLRQAAIELALPRLAVECVRVEDWRPPTGYGQITARAFADLRQLVLLTQHLLAPGGRWLAMKGAWPGAEIDALPAGIRVVDVQRLHVPDVDGERHLVVLERGTTET